MIFVTLGSQKFQFNRLLKKIDELVYNRIIDDDIFAQIGSSTYFPKYYKHVDFMDRIDFEKNMEHSTIVITHAGTGAIIGAAKRGKKIIAVPRQKKYGEHIDDHQIQIIKQFEKLNIIEPCYEVVDLKRAYERLLLNHYSKYKSNTMVIINSIDDYLEKNI